MRRWIPVLLTTALLACEPGTSTLVVQVSTDLSPGLEFTAVETALLSPSGRVPVRVPAVSPDDFVRGRQVAELSDLTPGTLGVRVSLLDGAGDVVLSRRVLVDFRVDAAVTVLLTRSCRGVTCPGAGDAPESSECLAGRCVEEECIDADECATECTSATDCRDTGSSCVVPECLGQACFYSLDEGACAAGESCDFALGCVGDPSDAGPPDGGVLDAGPPDGGVLDAGGCSGCMTAARCVPGDGNALCGVGGVACGQCVVPATCGGGAAGPGTCGTNACGAGAGTCADPIRLCAGMQASNTCGAGDERIVPGCGIPGGTEDVVFLACGNGILDLSPGFVMSVYSDLGDVPCGGSPMSCNVTSGLGSGCGLARGTWVVVEPMDGVCRPFTLTYTPL